MSPAAPKLRVLFLCTGNSCRSQMAEAWTRQFMGDLIEPYSAGTSPKPVDPLAIKAMAEAGVDISHARSKSIAEVMNIPFDYVVTVCSDANENCPFFPGPARRIHAGFDDPPRLAAGARSDEEALKHYRRVRDEIRAFVEALPHRLSQADAPDA